MHLIELLSASEIDLELVRACLIDMHERGETVEEIAALVAFLDSVKIVVPQVNDVPVFDVCGTGGTGKQRINLSTILAVYLSEEFCIAKHGNKASHGRCGSFDVVERSDFEVSKNHEDAQKNLNENNVAFLFGPAFHPMMGVVAPVRKSIAHATIFNFVGPLLNPMQNLTAQMIGVKDVATAQKLGKVCKLLKKNVFLVHDTVFGLDDVSVGGETYFVSVVDGEMETGTFVPEDFGVKRIDDFKLIAGGENIDENMKIFESFLNDSAPPAHAAFLEVNYAVAHRFFSIFA